MTMPKLIVCGDSFMTPITTHLGTHFSEIVAERLGFELTVYSRAGMSNGGIAVQIDTAIQHKPDLILIGTTGSDRTEYPAKSGGDWQSEFTIKDIQYRHPESVSSHYPWLNEDPKLISTNLLEIVDVYNNVEKRLHNFQWCDDPEKKKKAINDWFRYLYHPGWKRQTDQWMMYAILHKLHLSGIPYLFCVDRLLVADKCPWLAESTSNITHDFSNVLRINPKLPGYHTEVDNQRELAEYTIEHINMHFKELSHV